MAVEVAGQHARPSRAVRRRLARVTFVPGWATLAFVVLVSVAGVSLPIAVRYGVLLVTLVVLGLPHGAADHHSLARALDRTLSARFLVVFCAGYLALAAAYTVVWFLAPVVAFLAFIGLTWFHWGQGELYVLRSIPDDPHLTSRTARVLTVVVRGGLPMLVPLLFFPDRYAAVARTVVALFAPGGTAWLAPLFAGPVRASLGVGFAGVTAAALAVGARGAGSRRAWAVDTGETALLWLFFAVVPPVLAIGVYFAVWHSLRHVVRLVALDDIAVAALDRGAVWQAVGRFVRDALPGTIGALALFGGLALAVPATPGDVADIAGVYLVLLAVLTLPHVVVVTVLDRRQGVWSG